MLRTGFLLGVSSSGLSAATSRLSRYRHRCRKSSVQELARARLTDDEQIAAALADEHAAEF